jgi:hypothetical protein
MSRNKLSLKRILQEIIGGTYDDAWSSQQGRERQKSLDSSLVKVIDRFSQVGRDEVRDSVEILLYKGNKPKPNFSNRFRMDGVSYIPVMLGRYLHNEEGPALIPVESYEDFEKGLPALGAVYYLYNQPYESLEDYKKDVRRYQSERSKYMEDFVNAEPEKDYIRAEIEKEEKERKLKGMTDPSWRDKTIVQNPEEYRNLQSPTVPGKKPKK